MSGQPSSPPDLAATVRLDPENPWPGLVPYAEEHAAFFYGRDEETEELFRRVTRKAFFLLFGQSGLGKTSLLNASLYPKLRKAGFLPVDLRLDFPASEPFESQMFHQITGAIRTALLSAAFPRLGESLWFWFHRKDVTFRQSDGSVIIPVLVFDQFEEFFTIGSETDQARALTESFLSTLADLVENRVPASLDLLLESDPDIGRELVFGRQEYRVLICMREDYIANLDSLAPVMRSVVENRMRLLQMNGVQALQAINGPGAQIITPVISRKIVRFVAATRHPVSVFGDRNGDRNISGTWEDFERLRVDPSLLALVCRELNRRRQQRGLSQITEELLSGSGALDSILREFYESCVGDQPQSVRAFVEDELLTDSGFRETIAVERAERMLAQRNAEPSAMNLLVNRRLLRYEERLEIRRVELAHDVLAGVVKSSREERRSRGAVERAEEARNAEAKRRHIAEEERKAALRDKRRFRLIAIFALAFAVCAIIVGGLLGIQALKMQKRIQASNALINAGDDRLDSGRYMQAAVYFAAAYRIQEHFSTITELLEKGLIDCSRAALAKRIMVLKGHTRWVSSGAFCNDGQKLATGSWDRTIRLWDMNTGKSKVIAQLAGKVLSVNFNPEGNLIVAGCWNGYAYVWDLDGHLVATLDGHRGRVNYAAFSPDGKRIVTASDDSTARVWSWDGKPIFTVKDHTDSVKSAVFSMDGRKILTAGFDGTARIWDSFSGKSLLTINAANENQTELNFAAFSPNGERIATVGHSPEVLIWDLAGLKVEVLSFHHGSVNFVQFDHGGELLAAASDEDNVKVWQISTAQLYLSLESYKVKDLSAGRALCSVFSPDGTHLLITCGDATAQVWDTRLRKENLSELVTTIEKEAPWDIVSGRLQDKFLPEQ